MRLLFLLCFLILGIFAHKESQPPPFHARTPHYRGGYVIPSRQPYYRDGGYVNGHYDGPEYDPESYYQYGGFNGENMDDYDFIPYYRRSVKPVAKPHGQRFVPRRFRRSERSFGYFPSRGRRSIAGPLESQDVMEELLQKTQHGNDHYEALKKLGSDMFELYFDEIVTNYCLNNAGSESVDDLKKVKENQSKLGERKKKLEEERKVFLEKHGQKN